jgi:ABC-type phosphate transport system substrate-binding protein
MVRTAFLVILIACCALHVQAADSNPIVVIAHKSNTTDNMTHAQLKWIYSGRKNRWADGQKILVIDRPVQSDIRSFFYRVILGVKAGHEYRAAGTPTSLKFTKRKSDRSVKRFVSRMPNAIGYIYKSDVDDSVKVLAVDELTSDDKHYLLK